MSLLLFQYEVAVITKDGVQIKSPVVSQTNWDVAQYCKSPPLPPNSDYRDLECLPLLFQYEIAVITEDGVQIKSPVVAQTNLEVAH